MLKSVFLSGLFQEYFGFDICHVLKSYCHKPNPNVSETDIILPQSALKRYNRTVVQPSGQWVELVHKLF